MLKTEPEDIMYCVNHPNVETSISCSNCGNPICTKCMVFTPVGVKCPSCARPVGRMVRGVKPLFYFRSLGTGLLAGIISGFLLAELEALVRIGSLIFALALGYGIGEAVSWGAGRNGGTTFQVFAGISAFITFFLAGYFRLPPHPLRLLFALIGMGVAIARLRE